MPSGHDLAMRLRHAYLLLHRRTNAAMAPVGLTADQFVLLTSLADAGATPQKTLVRLTGSDPNTTSEMLARLERRGLVSRSPDADDRRARLVTLTDEGLRLQRAAWKASGPLRDLLARPASLGLADQLESLADALAEE